MVYLRVFAAVTWLIMTGLMAINWWFEEPLSLIGQAMLAYAVLYVLCSLVLKATDSVVMALRIWARRIERHC